MQLFTSSSSSPRLRFHTFTDKWNEITLKDISTRVTRKNKNNEADNPLTISAQFGMIDQMEFFNKSVASKDLSNYYLIKNGEFAYNKSYSSGYEVGVIKRLDRYNQGLLSPLYIVFKIHNIDSEFLVQYYDSTHWYKEIYNISAEGARNHGMLNVPVNGFFNTILYVPSSLEEQQKIGRFLKEVDDLISSYNRSLEYHKDLKQALLQRMFV
ncbi:type I site-specific deoxyribonuclease [Psittacicella melopsittaci]|uniref:Type I site-specific deoxyribonuclease n=1 Tax=Psittacicella melopsittaci TaxID=2028576 RepID=A0A3A1Y9I7_9GAMM|nr:type I site-specific deoxyribonuclease [Psittacicella melopsittaci]